MATKIGNRASIPYYRGAGGLGPSGPAKAFVMVNDIKLYGMLESGLLTYDDKQAVGMASTVEW